MAGPTGNMAAKGAAWAAIDRFGSMGIQFVVNLMLARILVPADFGIIGMLAIFIAVSQTLIDSGFASALIQKKHPTQTDYSTIFYWNLTFSSFLYLVLYLISPLVAEFFSMPLLTDVLRVIAINLIVTSVFAVQKTRLQKSLAFKTIACADLGSYILGGACGIAMARCGMGVWSLVGMQLVNGVSSVIILFVATRWTPSACFSVRSLRELFGFGGFIMAANILQTVCQNLQGLIIGRRFSATQMGYFSQAYKLDQITSYSIPQIFIQVMFPVYSSLQDDRERLNSMVLMNMRVISLVVFPILALLILVAGPLIKMLYGEEWLPSVPYFRVLCVGGFFVCLQNINYYAVAAVGKSRTLFRWSIYKWSFLIVALLVGMEFGMYGILWGMVLSNINICVVNVGLSARHNRLSVWSQIRAVLPVGLTVLLCGLLSFWGIACGLDVWLMAGVFVLCYLAGSLLVMRDSVKDLFAIVHLVLRRKNK